MKAIVVHNMLPNEHTIRIFGEKADVVSILCSFGVVNAQSGTLHYAKMCGQDVQSRTTFQVATLRPALVKTRDTYSLAAQR